MSKNVNVSYSAGFIDDQLAFLSYQKLSEYLNEPDHDRDRNPTSLLLLGDQVYLDPRAGFMDPRSQYDKYESPYFKLYSNPFVMSAMRKLPLAAMLDDHEIANNWGPIDVEAGQEESTENQRLRDKGIAAYLKFQRGILPPDKLSNLWFSFEQSGNYFFMMDVRTDRSLRTMQAINDKNATICCKEQMDDLKKWLLKIDKETPDKCKFVCSSSILVPRHRPRHFGSDDHQRSLRFDGWDGYPASLYETVSFICEEKIKNVIFLSGDEHMDCYASLKVKSNKSESEIVIKSIHCSGLYAPVPFANGKPSKLVDKERFIFKHKVKRDEIPYYCEVDSTFNLEDVSPGGKWSSEPFTIIKKGGFAVLEIR